jgi:hypothetical protein
MLLTGRVGMAQPAPSVPATPATALPAHREPTAGDLATARAALREGLALREKGEIHAALARLATAYDLVPTPVTGFELGKTHMVLGHVLQAHELFKKVVRMAPSMEESTRSQMARDEAARLATELGPRIPSLRLRLTLPGGATAVVHVDEEVIAMTSDEVLRAVDPGPHDVTAKAGDGPEQKVHVEVAEAETKDVALRPTWIPPKDPPVAKGRDIIYVRTTNPLAFVGFGVAAAAAVVTAIAFGSFVDAYNQAKALCGQSYCPPARGHGAPLRGGAISSSEFESQFTRENVSGAIVIIAGLSTIVFTGVGIVGALRPVREQVVAKAPAVTVEPTIGAGRLGVLGTF